MLNKKKIDKGLRNYIKEHLRKGYSKHAVKHVLLNHGYDESYVNSLLRQHSKIKLVKVYSILGSLFFLILIMFFRFNLIQTNKIQITGYAASIDSKDLGCCTSICQQSLKNECYGKFIEHKECKELDDCRVGCCIDKEGDCLTNYLQGNCLNGYGLFANKDCSDIVFCTNVTDKSYASNLHNIKTEKGIGILKINPFSGYYGSSFNILYYLYDKNSVLSVSANLKYSEKIVDSLNLYDDGLHNDGSKSDNIFGNNWFSSKINKFEGFKPLNVDILVKFSDGTQASFHNRNNIVLLNKNNCLPINDEWSNETDRQSIIFSGKNYDESGNGYQKFETDARNVLNLLFSIDVFSKEKNNFNVYRFEQLSSSNALNLINLISNSCPLYNNKKDLILVLDDKEDYCKLESVGVARLNSQILFYKNATGINIKDAFANFCSYVITPKKLADEIISFATPPKINVFTADNVTYNTSTIDFLFNISSSNFPVNASLYLEDSLVFSKILNEETYLNISLKLTNGTNAALISANDKNDNTAFSQLLLNATIK